MVNTTQFYKTKVALAVVLSLGLAACGDSEGNAGSTSESTSQVDSNQNTVGDEDTLTGTVQGVVVDSNANPLAGVAVYLGSQETVTNAGGQYVFTDVAVTNVSGVNNEGDEAIDPTTSTLVITIGGTADYLGALVTVTPQAQVNNTGGQGEDADGSNSDTTVQTFIDGFTAEAGIAVLPTLNAGAYGYVRDCRTGQPLADTADVLSLDFTGLTEDVVTVVAGNGVQLTTAEDTHTIATDADGKFSLTTLAANSGYVITAKEGWTLVGAAPAVATLSEGSSEYLSTIEVCPAGFTETDLTPGAPYINTVAGSIGSTTGAGATTYEYEVLGKGIDGTDGITLNFSEAISAADVDLSDVVVTLAANTDDTVQTEVEVASATLSDDGMSLTVVLVEALADEQRFSIWFPQHQYQDNKSNVIVTGDDEAAIIAATDAEDDLVIDTLAGDGAGSDEFGIVSDVFSQETGKIGYIRTRLCTYIAPPETPEGLEAEQLVKTLDSSLLAVSPSWDNEGGTTDVTNLNGQENAVAGKDTGERLAERFGDTFTNDTAVIVGSVDNATGVTASAGTVSYTASSGEFEIVVAGTAHNAKVTVTPTGAFGVSGTPVVVTLEDKVAPTTILQENYELWAIEADYSSTTASSGTGATGSGGEVTEGSITGDEGDPIIYIQPRHLTPTSSANLAERYEEFDAFAFDTDLDNEGTNDNPLYTGPAFAAWSDRGNSLGVAFSETIAVGSVAPLESASVTLALTGVLNGLTTDVDGNLIVGSVDTAGNTVIPKSGSDLARFTVADMIAFANNDHNEAIDFTNGSIVDTRGNLANGNSDARVVIRDAMPAFVTAGRWDGSNLILTFNETIVPENNDTLVLTNLAATATDYSLVLSSTATFPAEGAYSLNVAGNELTVAINAVNIAGLFQNGPNDEFEFDSDGDSIVENHLALNFDDIEDTQGNSWGTFDRDESFTALGFTVDSDNDATDDRQGRYLVDAPRFMVYNDVGIFTITKQTLGYSDAGVDGDDDGVVTLRFTFSHPIDLDGTAQGLSLDAAAVGGTYSGPSLTLAEANALFQIDLDGAGAGLAGNMADANGDFNAYFSSDYTTITLVLDEGANAIDALVTQVLFEDTVESAITDEALAAETYTVVNSN